MMDNRGSATIEIAIVLIVILMITAIVLSFSQTLNERTISMSENQNTKMLITEVVDNLINNPGVPENWQEYEKGTPGLAIVNEQGEIIPNSVSYFKFMALHKNYRKMVYKGLFDSKVKSSMELIPMESSISSVKIGDNDEKGNVYAMNRVVKCDFYKKYVIKDFENGGKCNHNHKQDSCSCNYFKVFEGNLKNSNYYLIIDENEDNLKYIVDTTRVVKERYFESVPSDVIYLNDKIQFYDDTSAIVFIHFDKPNAKAVLISTPKNFDKNKLNYDYFTTNECELIVKAWF